MNFLATGTGFFGISPSTDQLLVINLSAILVGTTFNAPQKVIKWGGLVIAVATAACAIFNCGG